MKYLIDTQILIWILIEPERIKPHVKELLAANQILVSQISIFEIAIKQRVDKLPNFPYELADLIEQLKIDGFELLPILNNHLSHYNAIPLFAEHRDPFDRLLAAIAFAENIPFISADENFGLYPEYVKWIKN